MTTKVKSAKVVNKSNTRTSSENVFNAGTTAAPAAGKVHGESINDKIAASLAMGEDYSVISLRSRVASHFAAPEWSGAAAVRAALAGVPGMTEEMIDGAVLAAAKKSGVDLSPLPCSVARVLVVVRRYYYKEFSNVVGCSLDELRSWLRGGLAVGSYSLRLPLGLVRADSVASDFLACASLPAGASASAVVSAVLSFRHVVSFRVASASAVAAARSDFFASLASAFRAGSRLGVSVKEMQEYIEEISVSVPASDAADEKRLKKNLSSAWSRCRRIEVDLVLAGCPDGIEDGEGGYCFPASLPASAPAKVHKLWAARVRQMSVISTLSALLARC